MITVIKEVCIFMIVAQAILFFVPGRSYIKYVRILVGIIMILRITEPIFALVLDDGNKQQIRDRIRMLEEDMDAAGMGLTVEDSSMELYENQLYESLEKELKCRLDTCESDYEIVQVRFSEEIYAGGGYSGNEEIIITITEKRHVEENAIRVEPVILGEKAADGSGQEELKEMYGSCIGIDAGKIKIVLK